jgi:hypothetical protein
MVTNKTTPTTNPTFIVRPPATLSTANVKAALMNQDGRPIYFTGRIRDLDTVKESVYITINVDAWAPSVLRFRLECPLAETFRSERPGRQSWALLTSPMYG